MSRFLLSAALLAVAAVSSSAHFVYVVPAKDGKTVTVVFSEGLEPDENVPVEKIAGLKLSARVAGNDVAVESKTTEHALTAPVPDGATLVYGRVTYGLYGKPDSKTLLVYHPKAVVGGTTGKAATVGDKAAVEVVPVADGEKLKFQFLVGGKPAADAEGSVMLPDGSSQKVTTDKDGLTPAFESTGRYAVYLKHTEPKGHTEDGKTYDVSHYATLVADSPAKAK